jgi:hypothetical protein
MVSKPNPLVSLHRFSENLSRELQRLPSNQEPRHYPIRRYTIIYITNFGMQLCDHPAYIETAKTGKGKRLTCLESIAKLAVFAPSLLFNPNALLWGDQYSLPSSQVVSPFGNLSQIFALTEISSSRYVGRPGSKWPRLRWRVSRTSSDLRSRSSCWKMLTLWRRSLHRGKAGRWLWG